MASVIYRVCNGANRTMVTITNSWASSETTRTYTQGSCQITERKRVLRFTASQAVDTEYRVWYVYTMEQYEDGVPLTPFPVMTQSFVMPPYQTIFDVEVFTYRYSRCTDDTGGIRLFEVAQ